MMAQEEPRTTRGGGMRGRRERRRLQMVFNHLREQHSPLRAAPLRRLAPLRITTTAQQPSNEDVDLRIEQGAVPSDVEIFDMECVSIRGFDRDEFLREGRWLWAGVMLPWVRRSWTAALQRVQALQDDMILQDWAA